MVLLALLVSVRLPPPKASEPALTLRTLTLLPAPVRLNVPVPVLARVPLPARGEDTLNVAPESTENVPLPLIVTARAVLKLEVASSVPPANVKPPEDAPRAPFAAT